MGSQVYGVATLRGGKSLPSIKRRILLCGKLEVIIRFIRKNMALALISSSSWKVAGNTAKSDCLIFRAQLSSGSAIKGAFAPSFFWSFCTIRRRDTMSITHGRLPPMDVHALRTSVSLWRAARARAHPGARGPNFNPISTCQNSNQHA